MLALDRVTLPWVGRAPIARRCIGNVVRCRDDAGPPMNVDDAVVEQATVVFDREVTVAMLVYIDSRVTQSPHDFVIDKF